MTKTSGFFSLVSLFIQSYRYADGFVLHQPWEEVLSMKQCSIPRPPRGDDEFMGRVTALASVPPTPSISTENKDIPSGNTPQSGVSLSSSFTREIQQTILKEVGEVWASILVAVDPFLPAKGSGAAEITNSVVQICEKIDSLVPAKQDEEGSNLLWVNQRLQLRRRALEFARYQFLCHLMQLDYDAYVTTATFLSPSRIQREHLPNVQDVPMVTSGRPTPLLASDQRSNDGDELVPDCELDAMVYEDSPLDQVLLQIFRKLVEQNTGGISSDKPGIAGLLDQGRTYMLVPGQTSEAQHEMVRKTLGGLMTPFLPPFYRIFMAGIVPPKLGTKWDGQQLGPWFYAPWLTSIVTPPFFQFLVGPSTPNRRRDGQLGGLLVEKCKFLQESNCKGLCLHQCKLPAQQFFMDELGVPLTVSPNFVTQECQWSFGEVPVPPADDPSFPAGCLAGCESRKQVSAMVSSRSPNGVKASLCSY